VVSTYEKAVERIGNAARLRKLKYKTQETLEKSPKKHNSDTDLPSFSPKRNGKRRVAIEA
jgi:hypothetical protein